MLLEILATLSVGSPVSRIGKLNARKREAR